MKDMSKTIKGWDKEIKSKNIINRWSKARYNYFLCLCDMLPDRLETSRLMHGDNSITGYYLRIYKLGSYWVCGYDKQEEDIRSGRKSFAGWFLWNKSRHLLTAIEKTLKNIEEIEYKI
jgi:hypothetical protein